MAARLWPHAWELLGIAVLAAVGVLEDAGFRRRVHPTLSRRTKEIPHAALAIAVLGPIVSWAYAAHVARLEEDPVPSCVAPPPCSWVRPTFPEEAV